MFVVYLCLYVFMCVCVQREGIWIDYTKPDEKNCRKIKKHSVTEGMFIFRGKC